MKKESKFAFVVGFSSLPLLFILAKFTGFKMEAEMVGMPAEPILWRTADPVGLLIVAVYVISLIFFTGILASYYDIEVNL